MMNFTNGKIHNRLQSWNRGMATKISAAKIANASADMVITNGDDVRNINRVIEGKEIGTLF